MFILLLLLSCGNKDVHTDQGLYTYQHSYTQKHKLSFVEFPSPPKSDQLGFTGKKPEKIKLMSPMRVIYADSFTQPPYSTFED